MEITNIDDWGNQPEFLARTRSALTQALEDPEGRNLVVHLRIHETGESKSRGLGNISVSPKDTDARALRDAIKQELTESLGEEVEGQIRANFYMSGSSNDPLTTYQRKVSQDGGAPSEAKTATEKMLERLVHRLVDANIDMSKAGAETTRAGGEALNGAAAVIKATNPQPDNWVQVLGAVVPLLASRMGGGGGGGQPQLSAPVTAPATGNVYLNKATGERVMLLASGQWMKHDPQTQSWQPCPPPPDFPGAGAPPAQGQIVQDAPLQAEDAGEERQPPRVGGLSKEEMQALLEDEDQRRELLRLIKSEAAAQGITDPKLLGAILATQLEGV